MGLKNNLSSLLILFCRIVWISLIVYFFSSKKSLDIILLIFATGVIIDGTIYEFFVGHENAKIKIGTSFFNLQIPQFYTAILIAASVILMLFYGDIKVKTDEKNFEERIKRTVEKILSSSQEPDNNTKNEHKTIKDLLVQAEELYRRDRFEECISLLDKIQTNDNVIIEKKAFYRILTLYKHYENKLINFIPVKEDDINNLEDLFTLYLKKYKESSKYTVIYYFYGHFQRIFRLNKQRALQVFDDMIDKHWYSTWIQGSLYYSALLHYELGDESNKLIAIERMKVLSKQDGYLKIFESGMTVDAAFVANSTLVNWGVSSVSIDDRAKEERNSVDTI